jgi:hypothetical protein
MSHIENFNTAFADEDDKEPALIINPLTLYFPRATCLLFVFCLSSSERSVRVIIELLL